MKAARILKPQKGQSFIELAVSFSILLVLLTGMLDTGTVFFSYMALRDAAQEGVNYGMYNPFDTAGIEARVRSASTQPIDLSDTNQVTVTILEDANPCLGKSLTVKVTYQFTITTPFLGGVIGSQTLPVSASANGTIVSQSCATLDEADD